MSASIYLTASAATRIRTGRYMEQKMVLKLSYGNAVAGEQRFPRPALEQRFMRTLMHSAGIKMFGLRRIGKSTLLAYAMEQMDENCQAYIYVNAQGLQSLSDLLCRLFEAMPQGG